VSQDANVLNIGRKEITSFFYLYMLLTFISLCIDSGVVPPGSQPYPYFAAVQAGLTSALCVCLLINGFVGFQLYEDGTPLSVWLLRSVSLVFFVITFLVALATFKSWAGLGPTHTIGLFVVLYLVSGICLVVYIVMQFILVINTLQDRWPLGDIAFGTGFLIVGQVILYALSNTICNQVQHYLDGLFFATICNLLAVMMVYKVSLFAGTFQLSHSQTSVLLTCHSTGTPSPERISSSLSAPKSTTGKSRALSQKTTAVATPSTKRLNTPTASLTLLRRGTPLMAASTTKDTPCLCLLKARSCDVMSLLD
jgi:hypothetical protein